MSRTAYKAAIVGAIVVASVATPWAVQRRARVQWRERNETWQRQAGRMSELSVENKRLSNLLAESEGSSFSNDQFLELLRLRGEIGRLRQTSSEIAKLRVKHQQLLTEKRKLEEQFRPPDPRTVQAYWPKSQLALAGYADPVSALETVLWAMSRCDPDALAASVTPKAKSELTREKFYVKGTSEEEMAASTGRIADSLSPCSGFSLVQQSLRSQDEVILDVYFEGEGKTRKFTMKRIGDAWKFDHLGSGIWP